MLMMTTDPMIPIPAEIPIPLATLLSLGASATLCLGQPAGTIQFSASTYEVSETNPT
jgi:hypothetical protein